jgi:hypothetical protein
MQPRDSSTIGNIPSPVVRLFAEVSMVDIPYRVLDDKVNKFIRLGQNNYPA